MAEAVHTVTPVQPAGRFLKENKDGIVYDLLSHWADLFVSKKGV